MNRDFDPGTLRALRKRKKLSMAALAERVGLSTAQVQRLESGQRRMTIDMLLALCDALDADVAQLFTRHPQVPVTGMVDSDDQVHPLPPHYETQTIAPTIVEDMARVAAIRWAPSGRFERMRDHYMFFYAHNDGVPDIAWEKRCLIMKEGGTQRIGWPIRDGKNHHIDGVEARSEFNTRIVWASPIIAVVPPFIIERLRANAR